MLSKFGKILRSSSLWLMSLVFTFLIAFGFVYVYMALSLPNVDQLRDVHLQVPLRIYTQDRKLIAEFGEKKRIPVAFDEVPPLLVRAILDTEDQRFYEHRGVDFVGIVRAGVAVLSSGRKTQGASTITMQVARNYFLSPEKTYLRKINEILLAFKLDRSFSKQEILELYLNKIYLGQRAYGVASASYVYFGKPLKDLSLAQMALIAGLPQAPSRDNPITNPKSALLRRAHVLQRMLEYKHITLAQYQEAVDSPLDISPQGLQVEVEAPYLAEMVRNAMVAQFGEDAYDEGYRVYTTVDSRLQNIANKTMRDNVMAYEERHGYRGVEGSLKGFFDRNGVEWHKQLHEIGIYGGLVPAGIIEVNDNYIKAITVNNDIVTINKNNFAWAVGKSNVSDKFSYGNIIRLRKTNDGWRFAQLPNIEGALVTLKVKDGAILALNGGFSYAHSNFNRAVQSGRQVGSAFKPFLYSAGLAKGYTLASIINDAPVAIPIAGTGMIWRPQNDNQRFYGPMRLRTALTMSRNLVSVRLLQSIGIPYAVNYIKQFGFSDNELPAMPSLALGVATISPLKLACGYAVFANGGYKVQPYFVEKIVDRDDKTIFEATPIRAGEINLANIEKTAINSDDDNNKQVKENVDDLEQDLYTQFTQQTTQPQSPSNSTLIAPQVITSDNAFLVTSALKDVVQFGTARRASKLKRNDLAGKTGTTNDKMDGWFAGYNNDIVTVTWMGFDKPKSIHEYGAQSALPMWIEFMDEALQGKPESNLPQPDSIVAMRINPDNGLLAPAGSKGSVFEYFSKSKVPTQDNVDGSADNNNSEASVDNVNQNTTSVNDENNQQSANNLLQFDQQEEESLKELF